MCCLSCCSERRHRLSKSSTLLSSNQRAARLKVASWRGIKRYQPTREPPCLCGSYFQFQEAALSIPKAQIIKYNRSEIKLHFSLLCFQCLTVTSGSNVHTWGLMRQQISGLISGNKLSDEYLGSSMEFHPIRSLKKQDWDFGTCARSPTAGLKLLLNDRIYASTCPVLFCSCDASYRC